MTEILSTEQMYQADQHAIDQGKTARELMQAAGEAVVQHVMATFQKQAILVLAGPGNNGGDGFVIAKRLLDESWPVRLCFVGNREKLSEKAALFLGN